MMPSSGEWTKFTIAIEKGVCDGGILCQNLKLESGRQTAVSDTGEKEKIGPLRKGGEVKNLDIKS